jgi:phage-related minor tail protein
VSGSGPLAFKDIPIASDEIKHKLQKARSQVKELPDIHRSIAEQNEEIKELEAKVAKQREVLKSLKDVGVAAKTEREEKERLRAADVMET